jgi:intein/homing endonuclease
MSNKLTIFQKISQIISPDSAKLKQKQPLTKRYDMGSDVLLKTTNKTEYDVKKLQAQQNKYLGKTWRKVESNIYQQSINSETTRLGSYSDFENMEYYPIIAAALDTFMEECLAGDTIIPLLDGTEETIKSLYENNKTNFWVYAVDIKENKIKPSKVDGVILKGVKDTYKLTLDDGSEIVCTDNHKWLTYDGIWIETKDLKFGDYLKSISKKSENNHKIINIEYIGLENVYDLLNSSVDSNFAVKCNSGMIISHNCTTLNDKGKVINIYSNSSRVKGVLEDLFFNRLDLHVSLPMWCRNICKTGDNFLFLNLSDEFGILGTKQLPNYEIERREGDLFDIFNNQSDYSASNNASGDKTKFIWRTHNIEFNSWQIAHFRLLGDDRKLPYGTALLEKSRRIWKQLILCVAKDTKIWTPIGYREIKDIKDNDEIYSFNPNTKKVIKTKVKKCWKTSDSKQLYKIKTKYNDIEVTDNHPLMVFNNENFIYKTILEIDLKKDKLVVPSINTGLDNMIFNMDYDDYYMSMNDIGISYYNDVVNKNGIVNLIKSKIDEKNYKNIHGFLKGKRRIKSSFLKKLNETLGITNDMVIHSSLHSAENILSIDESRVDEVWDLTVEDDLHNFIGNGIVVHNCEDAMLVYRVTRAPERRIYKIFVGNIDDDDVEAYVNSVADKFKRTPIVDPQTGQMDLKFNQLSIEQDFFIPTRSEDAPSPIETLPGACIALDTRIPLLDGRTLELNEIINEWNNGNRNLWVYSCDSKSGKLAPGLITWAGETRKNAEVLKITLDNGKEIISTPDHKFVHRTNGFVEAKDLVIGDSLMPFYTQTKKINNSKNEYKQTWDSNSNKWIYDHRMVSKFMKENNLAKYVTYNKKYEDYAKETIHHIDINRFNNNLDNLCFMNNKDHYEYHSDNFGKLFSKIGAYALSNKLKNDLIFKESYCANKSVKSKEMWAKFNETDRNKICENISKGLKKFINNLTSEEKLNRAKISINNSIKSRNKSINTFNNNPNKDKINKLRYDLIKKSKSTPEFKEKFSEIAKNNWLSDEYKNKVFSEPQKLIFNDNLYNIFLNTYNDIKNCSLILNELNSNSVFMFEFKNANLGIRSSMTNLNSFTVNHLNKMLKEKGFKNFSDFKKTSIENYNHKIVLIELLNDKQDTGTITVDGNEKYHNYHTFAIESGIFIKNSNLDAIADIQYLRDNLFTSLRVPKPFLGFDEANGEGKNLALQDIRFSRTINRIQQALLQELNKIAIIHLYLLGFEDDFDNFNLTLNNPSTQAEMLKIEQLQSKVTLYKDIVSDAGNGFSAYSMTRAKREILGMSDDDIKQDLLEQRMEKAAASELERTSDIIKHTGMFDVVDRVYGDIDAAKNGNENTSEKGDEKSNGGGGLGGSFGGGGVGGEDLNFGDVEGEVEALPDEETSNDETEQSIDNSGNEQNIGVESNKTTEEPDNNLSESFKKIDKLLIDKKNKLEIKIQERNNKLRKNSFDNLINTINHKDLNKSNKINVVDKTLRLNEDMNNMVNNIDKMLD